MTHSMSALRVFLKTGSGAITADLTVSLGSSIAMDMVVTGVAGRGSLIAANGNARAQVRA